MARLVALHAGGPRIAWQSLFPSSDFLSYLLSDVRLIVDEGSSPGLTGWTIAAGRDGHVSIDGISTTLVSSAPEMPKTSPIGNQQAVGLDHVVVNTDNIDRTCASIEKELGLEVRRERQLGNGAVQRFHKMDNTIIEVVSGPHVTTSGASLWGMVVSVDDLFELCEEVGENIASPPKKATQPGRYISTVRGSVGLGIPFALMTPHIGQAND
ncbi:MAG: hypothetical protein ACO3JF_01415 [Ilumatobacteraceae bacterium]